MSNGFSNQLGFVLTAIGSAVGIGNLCRFPYLVAKNGGGLFIIIYLILLSTLGFALLTSDIAIGRRTGKNVINAYTSINKKWSLLGILIFCVAAIITMYYGVIGGWILKYFIDFCYVDLNLISQSDYFTNFITSPMEPSLYCTVFMLLTTFIVYDGQKRIEHVSKIMVPMLFILIILLFLYVMTLDVQIGNKHRTGLEGLYNYLIPDFNGLTLKKFLGMLLDAMSQVFFSLSVSMGTLITYGSYVKKDVDLNKSIAQIEIGDTFSALLAGAIIIPAIYVFMGDTNLPWGLNLMFISLPNIFLSLGFIGRIIGIMFFAGAIFTALTSYMSIFEVIVANLHEVTHVNRKKICIIVTIIYLVISIVVALGYSKFYFELKLPNGSNAQLLDLLDYISNSIMLPLVALFSNIFIGYISTPSFIIEEMELNGYNFNKKLLYVVVVKYVIPLIMPILFLESAGILNLL